jgi:hypothetical protein
MYRKIKQIFAWFQIAIGAAGVLFFGLLALIDIFSGYKFGNGFIAAQGLLFYIPIFLWFLITGLFLLRGKLAGAIMSVITAIFICTAIFFFIKK